MFFAHGASQLGFYFVHYRKVWVAFQFGLENADGPRFTSRDRPIMRRSRNALTSEDRIAVLAGFPLVRGCGKVSNSARSVGSSDAAVRPARRRLLERLAEFGIPAHLPIGLGQVEKTGAGGFAPESPALDP